MLVTCVRDNKKEEFVYLSFNCNQMASEKWFSNKGTWALYVK